LKIWKYEKNPYGKYGNMKKTPMENMEI